MEQSYNLRFENNYFFDKNTLPDYAGIYLIYRAVYNRITQQGRILGLLYIGESDNIKLRHQNHEHENDFMKSLNDGEVLVYSTAPKDNEKIRKRIESTLIFYHKPPLNDKGKDSFGYDRTHIISSGKCPCLDKDFIVG